MKVWQFKRLIIQIIAMSVSLEENLTNSIRRAKERIYSHSGGTANEPGQESETTKAGSQHCFEGRGRAYSQKGGNTSGGGSSANINASQENALAAAMRNLQDRIMLLERENRQIRLQSQQAQGEKADRHCIEAVEDKSEELSLMRKENSSLMNRNTELTSRVAELEQEVKRTGRRMVEMEQQLDKNCRREQEESRQENNTISLLLKKDKQIVALQQKHHELTQRNSLSHQTIEQLMSEIEEKKKQLQQEKQTNLRWLRLYEQQQLTPTSNVSNVCNQNNSLSINQTLPLAHTEQQQQQQQKPRSKATASSQLHQKGSKQLYQALQRAKAKILQKNRECKQSEERYAKLKLLVVQVISNVNKVVPHGNSHLRFLMNRIEKLENAHLESFRSYSNQSRRNVFRRSPSHSREHNQKKSLKMSDLNSSGKKSADRSASSRKMRLAVEPLSHSEKKSRRRGVNVNVNEERKEREEREEEMQIAVLEKEIGALKKQHRNLIVRNERKGNEQSLGQKIDAVISEHDRKQRELEGLRGRRNEREMSPKRRETPPKRRECMLSLN